MEHKALPDTWLYKQTFSKLVPSPQLIQEVLDMTETKKRPKKFILRRLVVAALVVALAAALAMGANAATGGEFFKSVISIVSYSEDGETILMTVDSDSLDAAAEDGEPIYFSIEDEGNDKAFIMYRDKDGKDVKQEIKLPEEAGMEVGGNGKAEKQEGIEYSGIVPDKALAEDIAVYPENAFPKAALFHTKTEKSAKN